jgi:diguanylate cyclase (GGDEF)-like protein
MSFRFRLIAIVVVAIVALAGLNLAALDQVRTLDTENFAAHRAEARRLVATRLSEFFDELDSTAINLSKPREIVNALAAADNEALYDWSSAFVGNADHTMRVTKIAFVDNTGFVVARAPDEFRFGDNVSASLLFRQTKHDGSFVGIAPIDGKPHLVATRVLRKYDDLPVGGVAVSTPITPKILSILAGTDTVVLSYVDSDTAISSTGTLPAGHAISGVDLAVPQGRGHFRLDFLPDARRERMLRLQSALSFGAIGASLMTLGALLFTLRRQLAPYQTIVGGLLEYANRATGLSGLRDRLARLRGQPGEVGQVADALSQMIDQVDANFRSIARYAGQMEEMARADALTGLANRRGIEEALEGEIRRMRRYGGHFAVIITDIDHFKSFNDRFGHPTGDAILRCFAEILHANSRTTDVISRWGGEEFLLLCPDTRLDAAAAHAEKLRAALQGTAFPEGARITASFGVAECTPSDTLATLVARADRALYQAKSEGRNAVCASASLRD